MVFPDLESWTQYTHTGWDEHYDNSPSPNAIEFETVHSLWFIVLKLSPTREGDDVVGVAACGLGLSQLCCNILPILISDDTKLTSTLSIRQAHPNFMQGILGPIPWKWKWQFPKTHWRPIVCQRQFKVGTCWYWGPVSLVKTEVEYIMPIVRLCL